MEKKPDPMSKTPVNEIVLQVIDRGFGSLGESPRNALWYCLEQDFGFDRSKVPENIEAFEQALEKFFGLGYSFLESLLRNYLCEAIGERLDRYHSFAECVNYLREVSLDTK